ncbi:zinc ribbon domain-containing protein [Fuerstiella marisgermanici]|uniref:Zinc ribbon domain protein n=1 Tax=Fuerstiella marisgermanici TaxID=1891926 RepID=A0A1P8WLX8_9PLAN|nr:hypothetical protein [Fuerstiella marisgermanici]APZ95051.1 Putative zinc ribbon domain protein [Fuerstiella marisgermanici]
MSAAYAQLHQLLKHLYHAEQLLEHGPRRIVAAQNKVAAAEQACVDQKEQIQLLKKAADQNSLNLKSREADIQKLTGQLNQASSNKEYDIIQAQISAAKAGDAELEDKILSLFSQIDEATEELASRQEQLDLAKQKSSDVAAEVKEKEPGLKAEVSRLTAEIEQVEKAIPGGESNSAYKRLRASMGPSALALVDDGFCSECNTGATQQDVVRMNLGEFVLCRACGRILYQVGHEAS